MPLSITVVWGDRWGNDARLTPSLLNRIFEQATFQLQGTIDAASAPPGGIDSSWIGTTFVSGLPAATPVGADYVLGHDTSLGAPRKFLISDILGIGFAALVAVTTLEEADEFTVLVGGVQKKIALPLVRSELALAPNALTWTTVAFAADTLSLYDLDATEVKKVTPADLVRSVTDRVVTTAGTSTAFTATSGFSLSALATGIRLIIKLHAAFGLGATLAVDGLTAKALRGADDSALISGRLGSGRIVEVIYDAAANGAAGGWMVQGVEGTSEMTMVVFDGTIATTGGSCAMDGTTDAVTASGHGMVTGDVVWFTSPSGGVDDYTPYYAIVLTSSTFKLARTKALALAGTAIGLSDAGNYYLHWTANPLIRAVNVDGVVRRGPGRYYVDFTTALPTNTYAISLTTTKDDNAVTYGANVALDLTYYSRDQQGLGLTSYWDGDYDSPYVNLIVFP